MTEELNWLNASELEAWIGFAAVMNLLPSILDSELKAATGLSQFEYLVMARMSEMPGRMVQLKYLAVLSNGSLSRLSHVLTRLESRRWVVRQPLPEDGRLTIATLTESGWEKTVASAPHHLKSVREHVIDLLSPSQVRQLRTITRSLMSGLGIDLSEGAPPLPRFTGSLP